MLTRRRAVLTGLLVPTLMAWMLGGAARSPKPTPLVAGWSDEFNRLDWSPLPRPNCPELSLRRHGLLRLSLGPGATGVPSATPFFWASAVRVVDVDTDRYPILAVRAVDLKGPSWWDVDVQGCARRADLWTGFSAPPVDSGGAAGVEVKTPSLPHDGVLLFDLSAQAKNGLQLGSHRVRIRLNIAGTAPGGSVCYDWLRFVRREDAARVAANPRVSDLIVAP